MVEPLFPISPLPFILTVLLVYASPKSLMAKVMGQSATRGRMNSVCPSIVLKELRSND